MDMMKIVLLDAEVTISYPKQRQTSLGSSTARLRCYYRCPPLVATPSSRSSKPSKPLLYHTIILFLLVRPQILNVLFYPIISSEASLVPSRGSNARNLLELYTPESGTPKVYELRCRSTIRRGTDHMGTSFSMEAKVWTHSVAWTCTRLPGWNTTFFGACCSSFSSNADFRLAA